MKRPLNSGLFLCGLTGFLWGFGDCLGCVVKLVAVFVVGDEGDWLLVGGEDEAAFFELGFGDKV